MLLEEWKDIPSWRGLYQASSFGRIKSVINVREVYGKHGLYQRPYGGTILSPKTGDGGYLYVNLWKENIGHMRAVHRLVCEAFNPNKDFETLVTNHLDGNRANNLPSNLEFITQKENLIDAEKRNGYPSWKGRLNQPKTSGRITLSKT